MVGLGICEIVEPGIPAEDQPATWIARNADRREVERLRQGHVLPSDVSYGQVGAWPVFSRSAAGGEGVTAGRIVGRFLYAVRCSLCCRASGGKAWKAGNS